MLFICFLAVFVFLSSLQAVPPLLPQIMEEYRLTHTIASTLILLVALPAVFTSLLGGVLVDRYGAKNLVSIGLVLVCTGDLLSIYPALFVVMGVGRLVLGVGGAVTGVSAMALISQCFSQKERGLAMGIFGLSMPLATVFSFNLLGTLGSMYSWRLSILISLGISIAVLFIWMASVRKKPILKENKSNKFSLSLGNRQIWLLGLAWATFNMAIISFTTWGPKLFEDFWMLASSRANFLASMLMIGSLIAPLTGYISDRLGRRRILIIFSALGMTVLLFLLPFSSDLTLFLLTALLGLVGAFSVPSILALPIEILDRASIGLGYGILNTCLNIGIITGTLLTGAVIDLTQNATIVFSVMALFVAVTFSFVLPLKTR